MPLKKSSFQVFWRSLFIGLLIALWLEWPSSPENVIKFWVQPADVSYGSSRYTLSIVQKNLINPVFSLFSGYRHYDIFISRSAANSKEISSYGHRKEYGFSGNGAKVLESLERSSVAWEKEGIRFKEPSGHELFFPKSSFVGGR
ncbi:hypothetical protein OAM69_07450 [bacterium]|nr:hypothetical protein [bacterium]